MSLNNSMRDAVEINGGRIDEERYLSEVQRLVAESGGSTSITSLKSNAFNRKRMDQVGICRVSFGDIKEVWMKSIAEGVFSGSAAPVVSTQPKNTQVERDNTTDEGTSYGIRRRSPEEFPEHIQQYIIPRGTLRFVESEKNEMRLLSMAFKYNFNVVANGPKGCGKTMGMLAWASAIGVPVIRINCSEGFTEESFIGYNTLIDGEVVWIDGALPTAMRHGCLIIFDEFRHARPEIMTAWNAVGDSGRLLIPQNNNEVIVAHDDFRTYATMNPLEGYSGGQDLNQATLDRFGMALECDYLPADAEMSVLMEQSGVQNPALARQFVSLANDLRRLKSEHEMESDTSTRMLVDMMTASQDFNDAEIIDYVMCGRYQSHEVALIKTTARARLADY